jgi:hypothetical protein
MHDGGEFLIFACQGLLDGGKLTKACASIKTLGGQRMPLVQLLCAEDHTTDPPLRTGKFLCLCCVAKSLPHVPEDDLVDALALMPGASVKIY